MLLLPLTNCIRDPAYILETLLLLKTGYTCHTAVINFSIADKTNMVMATLEMFCSFSLVISRHTLMLLIWLLSFSLCFSRLILRLPPVPVSIVIHLSHWRRIHRPRFDVTFYHHSSPIHLVACCPCEHGVPACHLCWIRIPLVLR